ncbi:porin [Photobacterium sanguinicancri]|uniref:Porin n=1 Tax=Photobacterium sanguinicancri TaxID=875932 RepID=A0AAW7XXL6_9GAMM|nr:porin [Photobacterium sanguinicancri]MDO6540894.1 porin [Photobacterium sanguinicancri]
MKKTLLALTVPALLVAGSASAAVSLYDQDGTQVTMSGAAEVQYYRSAKADAYAKAANTDADASLRIDDGDLALRVQHEVSADLYALGAIELAIGETKDNKVSQGKSSGDVVNDGLYVGLGGAFGEMTFGRQLAIIDDAGVGVDIELKDTAGVNYEDTDMDQYIKYRFSGEKFWAGAGYNIAQEDATGKKGEELLEIAAGVPFGDFEARAYYADYKNEQATAEQKAWDLEFVYAAGPIYVGALYGQSDNGAAKNSDIQTWELAGSYTMGKNTFGLGYAQNSGDAKSQDAMNLYANVAHQLTANTRAYVELGYEDVKAVEEKGFGYVVGMEVKF